MYFMWFLALVVSLVLGLFSPLQLFLCLFYGLPYSSTLSVEYKSIKQKYMIGAIFHSIIMIVGIILMFTVLRSVWWSVFVGFIVIPFIISLFQKNIAIKEIENTVKELNTLKETKIEISKDVSTDLNIQEFGTEKKSFSKAEIVMFAINLQDLKEKLTPEEFAKANKRFIEYQSMPEYQVQMMLNFFQLSNYIKVIQDEFAKIINRDIANDGTVVEKQIYCSQEENINLQAREGYGFSLDEPISVCSIQIMHELIKNLTLKQMSWLHHYKRIGSFKSKYYEGYVDKFELCYCIKENQTTKFETYELYFCAYPKIGQDQIDFILSCYIIEDIKLPEGFILRNQNNQL